MDHLPMPKLGRWPDYVVFSGIEIAGPFAGQMFAEWGGSYLDRERRLGRHHSRSTELPAALPPQFACAVVKYFQR